MRNKYLWLILAALVLSAGIGGTVAYLVASSRLVENTFTVGKVSLTLTETTGTDYSLLPGTEQMKDPVVTVKAGSEESWLFVQMEKSPDFDRYCRFEMREEWTLLDGETGIYYQIVPASAVDRVYRILKNDRVFVFETLTEEVLAAVTEVPTLDVTAFAVQRDGISTPQEAWQILKEEA